MLKTLSIGKAAAYAIANWERLTRFADNALIPLDNNGTERAIRGPVVGRKSLRFEVASWNRSCRDLLHARRPRSFTASIPQSTCSKPCAQPIAERPSAPGRCPRRERRPATTPAARIQDGARREVTEEGTDSDADEGQSSGPSRRGQTVCA